MEELIGFVASNNKLGKILAVLDSKGAMDIASITKNVRIVGTEKSVEELIGKKLIVQQEGKYVLTDLGKEVTHKLRGVR